MAAITWVNLTAQTNYNSGTTALSKASGSDDVGDAGAQSSVPLTADGEVTITQPALGQMVIGLDPSATAVAWNELDYAFNIQQSGAFDMRESGAYVGEDSYSTGAVWKITRTGTTIKYYLNNVLKRTSTVPSSASLYVHVLLYDVGNAITTGTITGAGSPSIPTLPEPSAVTQTAAPVSYSNAITHTNALALPINTPPTVPALHATYTDPLFNQYIRRGTDGTVGGPGALGKSHRMPSSEVCCVWSRDSSQLYAVTPNGTIELYSIDQSTDTATRGKLTYIRDLTFNTEPTFSRVTAKVIYGVSGFKVKRYDTQTNTYTDLADLAVLDPSYTVGGLVMGGSVQSSMSNPERIAIFYGGNQQDAHFRCMVFDADNLNNKLVLDTQARTINGVAVTMDQFHLHAIAIDLSGRFVILYSTNADEIADPTGNSQIYVWDTANGTVTEMTNAMFPFGHVAVGWKTMVNQDPGSGTFDALQWQYRALDNIAASADVLPVQMTPSMTYMGDHPVWTNGRSDVVTPFFTATQRINEDIAVNLEVGGNRTNTVAYRAGDNEIIAVHPVTGALYRFCHHWANGYTDDGSGINNGFWYQPMAHPSPDGRFIVFSSNWWKQLGNDAAGTPAIAKRSDLFVLDTTWVVGTPATPAVTITAVASFTVKRQNEQTITINKGEEMGQLLEVYRGSAKKFNVNVTGGGITGFSLEATVRDSTGAVRATIPCPVVSDTQFSLTFTSAISLGLSTGGYEIDVWRNNAGAEEPLVLPTPLVVQGSVRFP